MPESLLTKAANWFMGISPKNHHCDKSIESLRNEFDSWVNCPQKKKASRKLNRKRRSRLDGQAYADACEMKFGKYRRTQNA